MSCLKILLSINESRELLLKYATKNMNSELILFIIDLEKYKKNNSIEMFMYLIQTYIMKDSQYELNISHELRNGMHINNDQEEFKQVEIHVKMLINTHLLTDNFCDFVTKYYEELEKDKPKLYNMFKKRPLIRSL